MDLHAAFLNSIIDSDFYESIEVNEPGSELSGVVYRFIPKEAGWRMLVGGYWTYVAHETDAKLIQGWKIHLSASQRTAKKLLETVVPIFERHRVGFKFLSDENVVDISLNKNAARTAAGKFITVYPPDLESFKEIIEEIHQATIDFRGPFLLTDRPYKDSKVVFYRYGEHHGSDRVDVDGRRQAGIQDPDGNWISDERRAYFYLPDWIEDPFDGWQPVEPPKEGAVMLKDRYRVESALRFHATGAVYAGVDTHTDQPVIIREARPVHRGSDEEREEGFLLLEKEARILEKLGPDGLAPKLVDLFQEWEHFFLVQEKVDADTLWGYSIGFSHGSKDIRPSFIFERLRETFLKIAKGLQTIHSHGIVLRDITRTNILVTHDTEEMRFIDFEFSYELDRDDPSIPGYTEGYSSPEQLRNEKPHPGEDVYSLGALIIDMLAFTAPGLSLNRQGILDSFRMTVEDYHLPHQLYEIIAGALEEDKEKRWSLERMINHIQTAELPTADVTVVPVGTCPPQRPTPDLELVTEIDGTLTEMARFIQHHTTPNRKDRLWPGGPDIYQSNALQLAYGAAGTAVFLHRVGSPVSDEALEWMRKSIDLEHIAPGLFTGLSGIALSFLELGDEDTARMVMEGANQSPIRLQRAEMRAGASGWGLANLHFHRHFGEGSYLSHAMEAGEYLLKTQKHDDNGGYWEVEAGIPLGFGHGQSGPATFLLYLNEIQPGHGFLEAAIAAVDFEIAHRQQLDDEVLWFPHVGASGGSPKSPHMRHGSAGVGTAVLRAWAATGEDRLRKFADVCALSVSCRGTNKLWHDYGLAGYGELLLDMYDFTGDENYRNNAFYLAEALMPYRLQRKEGIAFPAEELVRISTDFASGMAGVGIFLHRLVNPGTRRFLLLDDLLLKAEPKPAESAIQQSVIHTAVA